MKFGSIVLQENTHQLTESDFWFDVIRSKWRSWRHFTQKNAAIWWVHNTAVHSTTSAWRICSSISHFQICSAFVLVVILEHPLLGTIVFCGKFFQVPQASLPQSHCGKFSAC